MDQDEVEERFEDQEGEYEVQGELQPEDYPEEHHHRAINDELDDSDVEIEI